MLHRPLLPAVLLVPAWLPAQQAEGDRVRWQCEALWQTPAAVGNPFHFANVAGSYPYVPLVYPDPAVVSAFAGATLDAVVVLWQGQDVVAVSNLARLQLP